MSERARITGAAFNLPDDFVEDTEALTVTHNYSNKPDHYSLSIGNHEMWIRGSKESLTNLVDSLVYRINHLPGD
jgi:hypothetical protein